MEQQLITTFRNKCGVLITDITILLYIHQKKKMGRVKVEFLLLERPCALGVPSAYPRPSVAYLFSQQRQNQLPSRLCAHLPRISRSRDHIICSSVISFCSHFIGHISEIFVAYQGILENPIKVAGFFPQTICTHTHIT